MSDTPAEVAHAGRVRVETSRKRVRVYRIDGTDQERPRTQFS